MLSNAPVIDQTRAFFDAGIPRTPWFRPEEKPAHVGDYEEGDDLDAGAVHWDGQQWLSFHAHEPIKGGFCWRGAVQAC